MNNKHGPHPGFSNISHAEGLAILARSEDASLKLLAENILQQIGQVKVLKNRTGLVMAPHEDLVEGGAFHLGEVLVSEAQVFLCDYDAVGYGACLGYDLERSMAIAVLDAGALIGSHSEQISAFVALQAEQLNQEDRELLQKSSATKIELETF